MKVMKKVIGVLVVFTLFIFNATGVNASTNELTLAKTYYQQLEDNTLVYADDILAVEALGIEVEDPANGFDTTEFLETDFSTLKAGALGKTILAICLIDQNPRNINGVDLVQMLESYYQADGSFENKGVEDWVTVGTVPFDVLALKAVGSTLDMSKTVEYFTSQQDASGAFGYEFNGFNIEYASTGWAMMALHSLQETQASAKAKAFLDSAIDTTLHGWAQYNGLDTNNQASVLWSLYELGYTDYTMEHQALLAFQCTNGAFGFTDNSKPNSMATQQAMLALGVKENGSIITKAKKEYQETINPPKQDTVVSPDQSIEVSGVLPVGTKVQMNMINDVTSFENSIKNTFNINIKQLAVMDITLLDAIGNPIQPGDKVTVKVKLPTGFSKDTTVYHELHDGRLVNVPVTIENGYATFKTDSFSKFVFVEAKTTTIITPTPDVTQMVPTSTQPNGSKVVNTSDSTTISMLVMSLVASAFMFVAFVERKKKI